MGKISLKKIRVVGLKKHYKLLMRELHRLGVVEIVKTESLVEGSCAESMDHFGVYDQARVDFAIRFLGKYADKKQKTGGILSGGKMVLSETEAGAILRNFEGKSEDVLRRTEIVEESMVRNENTLEKLKSTREKISVFKGMDYVFGATEHSAQTSTSFVIGKSKQLKEFVRALAASTNLVQTDIVYSYEKDVVVRVVCFSSVEEQCKELSEEFGFSPLDFGVDVSSYTGKTVDQVLKELDAQEKVLIEDSQKYEKEAQVLASHLPELKVLYDFNTWRHEKNNKQSEMYTSDRLFVFDGWVAEDELSVLQRWVENVFVGEVSVDQMELVEGEKVPTKMDNGFCVSPFEVFTNMYGAPSKGDVDPTPFMAPFFFVFFGLCFSDVGYGALLLLVSAFFLIFGKFPTDARKAFWLLFFCGVSTIIGGILLGGYFGLTPEQLPAFMSTTNIVPNTVDTPMLVGQIFSPLDQPQVFLKLSLVLGAIHLVVGVILNGVKAWLAGEKNKVFLEAAPWVLLLASLVTFGFAGDFNTLLGREYFSKDLFKNLAIGGAAWLFLGHIVLDALAGKSILKVLLVGPLMGVLKLYGITEYLTDLLSYSRVMALGLATGVIGYAMNLSAITLAELIPVVGVGIAVAFVLFGHVLNFGLSILAAFIHTGRLQFVEFFSKFYDGTGGRFAPFKRASKYLFFRS